MIMLVFLLENHTRYQLQVEKSGTGCAKDDVMMMVTMTVPRKSACFRFKTILKRDRLLFT